jgi:putative ABC transport system permease protein
VSTLLRRAWYAIRQRQFHAELAEEMEFHREMKQRELEGAGLSRDDAAAASRKALGNATLAREDAREVWIWRWLDFLAQDGAYATRRLKANPGFSAIAIITLGVVIGANSAMFSAVYTVLLRPFAVQDPGGLVFVWGSDPTRNLPLVELSYRTFEDWSSHSRSFTQAAAVGSSTWPALLDGPESTRVSLAGVSDSFFGTLGVRPIIGRDFGAQDNQPNTPRVVIVSHGMWLRRFGGDPQVVGRTLQLNDISHTIVGVTPEAFDFPRGADLWTPVVPIIVQDWGTEALEQVGALFVIGRLRTGVTSIMVAEELQRLSEAPETRSSHTAFGSRVVVTRFLDYVLGPVRYGLWALLAAVGLLLLVGCVNLSGVMLTRVSSRRREHAVLIALGATRIALARRWLMETLMLSVAGGIVGLLASHWIGRMMLTFAPDIPRLADLEINPPVVMFTFAVMLLTTLLCAWAPIRSDSAHNLSALNESARSTPSRQIRHTQSILVILQVAVSVILIIATGLIVRSFVNLRSVDVGFLSSNVMTMTIEPRTVSGAPNVWMDQLLDRLAAVPGVEGTGAVYLRPLALGPIGQETWVMLEGQQDTPDAARQNPQLNYQVATPGYFSAMRIRLRQGRLFTAEDTARSPRVALVSETTAERLWPGENPIGKRLLLPSFTPDKPSNEWRTIVGVVNDVRYRGLDDQRLDVYDLAVQASVAAKDVVIRTSGDPLNVLDAVRAEVRRLDPRAVVDRVTTMDAIVSRAMAPWRLSVWSFSAFAGIAIVLVTGGLFSVVSLDLSQRHKEFAVKRALGAQNADIVWPVLLAALRRGIVGIALGVLSALVVAQGLSSMLFGVDAFDLRTYGAVVTLVLATVIIASSLPAWRAMRADPMVALRCE